MKGNQIKLGALLSYASIGIKIAISLVYTPVMLRMLGQHEYGLYQLSASIVSNLSILILGFGSSYVRFYSTAKTQKDKQSISNLNGMYLLINGLLAIVVLLVGFFLAQQPRLVFGSELTNAELLISQQLLVILVINLALSFVNMLFNSYITANQNFVFQRLLEILQAFTSPFLQLPLLMLGYGSLGVVLGTTITSIIIYLINIIYCFKKLDMQISLKQIDFSLFKEIGKYSSFIFIAMLIDQINWSIDIYLVGRLKGAAATAVYSIAELIDSYFRNFISAFSAVLIPTVHMLIADKADDSVISNFFARFGRIQYAILALFGTGFVFFGHPFIFFWAGEGYEDSYIIALILLLPLMFIGSQTIGIEIRRAKNKQRFYTIVSFFTAVINVVLTAFLLNFFPPVSAAFSTSITLLINTIILNWDYHKNLGLNMKLFWGNISNISLALIPPIIYGVIVVSYVNLYELSQLLISGIMYVIIYAVSFWIIGLNNEEKQMVVFRRKKKE